MHGGTMTINKVIDILEKSDSYLEFKFFHFYPEMLKQEVVWKPVSGYNLNNFSRIFFQISRFFAILVIFLAPFYRKLC